MILQNIQRTLGSLLIGGALISTPLLSCSDSEERLAERVDSEEKGFYLSTSLWREAEIKVCWEDITTISDSDREKVRAAVADSWEAYSLLRFKGWAQCDQYSRGIRVAVRDAGPHVKRLGKSLDGVKEGMVINTEFNNWDPSCNESPEKRESCLRAVVVHEFGHAIGIAHEQNREDTPDYCRDAPQGTNGDVMVGDWDPHSVMNYCNDVFANDGILSPGDIATVQAAYDFLNTEGIEINTTPATQPEHAPEVQLCEIGGYKGECTAGECRGGSFPNRCDDSSQRCCVMLR